MNYLVTSIGSLSAEAVIASLRMLPGARITGCNSLPPEWIATTSLVDVVHKIPPATEPIAYISSLLQICRSERIERILPLTDSEVDVLNENREVFASCGTIICIASQDAIRACRDKLRVHEIFHATPDVSTIPTWDMDDLPNFVLPFPIIAKPRTGRSSEGLIDLHDQVDLLYYRKKLYNRNYIVQPHISGMVCVVDIVRQKETGLCASVSRKELIRTSNGAGLTVQMLHDEKLHTIAQRIVETLDINGCINIEFLVDSKEPFLMDINPRFSAGVIFSKLAGYDMIFNHLRCFDDDPIDIVTQPSSSIYTRRYVEVMTFSSTE